MEKLPPAFTGVAEVNRDFKWYREGQLHRDGDLPAIEFLCGSKWWYQHGKLHRDGNQPAKEHIDGHREWWINGELHRDGDQPAIVCPNGKRGESWRQWFVRGKCHRKYNKPAFVSSKGNKGWYCHGKVLRTRTYIQADTSILDIWWDARTKTRSCVTAKDGSLKFYDAQDRLHCDDGPAVRKTCGKHEWWTHGTKDFGFKLTDCVRRYQFISGILQPAACRHPLTAHTTRS